MENFLQMKGKFPSLGVAGPSGFVQETIDLTRAWFGPLTKPIALKDINNISKDINCFAE